MADERRRYLRVLFEETIQVQTEDWTDPMATGLDISLNGVRFHCEHSLTEGAKVNILLQPGLQLQGEVRWCWPIEWYYQAAVEFVEIVQEDQVRLRDYISEAMGETYPDYFEVEQAAAEGLAEIGLFFGEMPDISMENDLFEDEPDLALEDEPELAIEGDLTSEEHYQGTLTPFAFANKHIVIVDEDKNRSETIKHYLTKRNRFSVAQSEKKSHLWPLLKGQPADLILLSWSLEGEEGLKMLQGIQQRFPEVPVIFLGGAVSLEDRLGGLNEGAVDFLTRPFSLSSVSQSILKAFAFADPSHEGLVPGFEPKDDDFALGDDLDDDFLDEDSEVP